LICRISKIILAAEKVVSKGGLYTFPVRLSQAQTHTPEALPVVRHNMPSQFCEDYSLLNYCVSSGLYMILFIVNRRLEVLGSVPTSKIVTNQAPPSRASALHTGRKQME
jgi:hypothetical protein